MIPAEHEEYAKAILSCLSDDHPEVENLNFQPDRSQSRNAARAMTAMLCHRLFKKTGHLPRREENTTYEWRDGIFNCRNIADRDYLWTNMRRPLADKIHESASEKPVAYLLAFSHPSDGKLNVWAIPEPLLYDSLSSLSPKEGGNEYTVQISPKRQRIEGYDASPDLGSFFQELPLSRQELLVLRRAREADALKKRERANARGLGTLTQQLVERGGFDPSGLVDARKRILSSIVRRMGQPAFRQDLLAAYKGRCVITGCGVEQVLDAAHIIPYMGPETNHPANGLLLRTDLHTLFDLKLIAIDAATMTLLISPFLQGTCYQQYQGSPIKIPDDPDRRPSPQALERHRKESGL
jgi:hypothetical protein